MDKQRATLAIRQARVFPLVPLTPTQVDVLICVYEMQPATASLVEVARGTVKSGVQGILRQFVEKGLARREKSTQQPALTLEEKAGFTVGKLRAGKRPYVYRLTPKGERIARWLQLASKEFETVRPDSTRLNNRPELFGATV